MKGYNDDLIMACAIACWIKDTVYTVNKREMAYKKAFLDSMVKTNNSLDTSIPGMIKSKPIQDKEQHQKYKEFAWLLKG